MIDYHLALYIILNSYHGNIKRCCSLIIQIMIAKLFGKDRRPVRVGGARTRYIFNL
jgi:hypothetical protein